VLLIDDHLSFAQALRLAVKSSGDLDCVGIASTMSQAQDLLAEVEADVVVLDLGVPDTDGVDGIAQVRRDRPDRRVLVLTGRPELEALRESILAGAAGFLNKDVPLATVLDAIRHLPSENALVSRSALLAAIPASPPAPRVGGGGLALTGRELEVLRLLIAGQRPKAIATELQISLSTCRGYIQNLLVKLGAHSQLEAVSIARREGLLDVAAVGAGERS
jgi:DNA-binding NarL/FixJ family response regulator